ncbi:MULTISPECIES: DNA-binding protein [unclassified Mesorhizobium]|uniref:DNA-binding protein n=1 Tax=unclassified Mesorhizobium TaxID=325217 RepID=UPI003336EEDB
MANTDLDIIWGAKAIADLLNCDERKAFYLLESGSIPGARKLAGRWCVARQKLHDLFLGTEAA